MRGFRSLNTVPKRCYAAGRRVEALRFSTAASPQDVQVSKLTNGLVVASLENHSPLCNVGLFIKAGSRYETADNFGVSHVLRLAANLTNKNASGLKMCRSLEALGGSLSVTSSRETMVYTATCLRDHLQLFLETLVDVTTAQEFRPWEVSELTSRVKIDRAVAQQCPQTSVIETLHRAAYKNGLSNSLYCPDYMDGRISPEQLQSFVEENFSTGRMAVVGLGVKHSVLRRVGEELSGRRGAGVATDKSVYRGGEQRVQNSDSLVHAAIASEGGVMGSAEANAFSVLQRILGTGPHVKRGSNITGKLSLGIGKATALPFHAAAFNASYSDSGLFGVYTITQAGLAGEVIQAAVAQVRAVAEGKVTEADMTRAKKQVTAEYLMSVESSDVLMEEVGAQALTTAAYKAPHMVLQTIDGVTQEDVVKAAKKFVDGKKTMAASGQLVNTPFVDEL